MHTEISLKDKQRLAKIVVLVTFCLECVLANKFAYVVVCMYILCPASATSPHSPSHLTHLTLFSFRWLFFSIFFLSFRFRFIGGQAKEGSPKVSRPKKGWGREWGICKINTNITHRYVLQPAIIPTHLYIFLSLVLDTFLWF